MHRNEMSLYVKRKTGLVEQRDKKGEFVTFGRRDEQSRRSKRFFRGCTGRKA